MKYERRSISNGKLIEIYDDVFTSSERYLHLIKAQNYPFILGYPTTNILWQSGDTFFTHVITNEDLIDLNINKTNFFKEVISNGLSEYELERSWVLVSSPFSTYYYHVDNSVETVKRKTLLYYLNNRWDRNWGGETLFANDSGDCEVAVAYKPGRVVIFDGSIEHKPSAISIKADEFRFIFVIQFVERTCSETLASA
jgi:hypothetical protein